jgi:GWxTD domain-containing protein
MNCCQKKKRKIGALSVWLQSFWLGIFWLFLTLPSCRLYNLERKLDPVNEKFLSEVRYIITGEERKNFLELPDSERENFKKEFWKRHDPDPDTEENEFQMEYYNRLESANKLFISEGRPGFLTDRGRIYILFGPPTDRITYPMGASSQDQCSEVWYYDNFPVVFVDNHCSGDYRLVTYDLTSLREFNLMYMHELSLAQAKAQKIYSQDKSLFDFDWSIKKKIIGPDKIEGKVIVRIPYSRIWFNTKEEILETEVEVHLELKDALGKIIWEHREVFPISDKEEKIREKSKEQYTIEIPFSIETSLEKLKQQRSFMYIFVKNKIGNEELKKVMEFRL